MTGQPNSKPPRALRRDVGQVLSADARTRAVEVAFLERIAASFLDVNVATLSAAQASERRDTFGANYARMRSPVWSRLAAGLARDAPLDTGFGRFRVRE